ncbi:TlpA family protein disulfide reductase [Candidatus Curtissbacteria bacterium]|nr:TlpA family protein disulfide reductase [Candidatus Curtissbacteria bacterium]
MKQAPLVSIVFIVLGVVVAGIFLANRPKAPFTKQSQDQPRVSQDQEAVGQEAPDFSLETFDGGQVSLASQRGKAVFVDFWAAWCPFCVEEMPEIEKISAEFGDQLVVLGIHRTETEDVGTGKKFADGRGVTYQLLKDSDGSIYKTYTGGRKQYVKQALGQTN